MNESNNPLIQNNDDEHINLITEKIIGCAFKVSNTLGVGFLEKVYENALALELTNAGMQVEQQRSIQVWYMGKVVGDFTADLLEENQVLVELKAVKSLDQVHFAQCINYLKATRLQICLLINFGKPRIDIQRFIN